MNAERLLQVYEQISEAPDAIARLRRFVLDLAVRGKLVEQDAADEPASVLMKAAKALQTKEGVKIKADPLQPSETPFQAPLGWLWTRVGVIALQTGSGSTPRGGKSAYADEGTPFLRSQNIYDDGLRLDDVVFISDETNQKMKRTQVKAKDLLLNITGGSIGRCTCVPDKFAGANVSQHVAIIRTAASGTEDYLHLLIRSPFFQGYVIGEQTGAGRGGLPKNRMDRIPVPLPPLAEQHRIVAKVDELMALCDRLEEARKTREEVRDQLTAASLARLSAPDTTAEEFPTHAAFALEALPALTTRPDQIKTLRHTILNLAVRGKLVEQDAADEPAAVMMPRLAAEKERLREEKGIKRQKAAEPSEDFESTAVLPASWAHTYLQDLAYQITDGTHLTPKYTENGRPFLSAQNVKPFRFMPERHRFVSPEHFEKYRANRKPEKGDVLLTRVGAGIGEAAVLDSDFEFAFYVSLCLIKIPQAFLLPEYLVLWLNSPEGRENSEVRTYGKGASQGNLNLGLIRTFKVPVPPIAEQHRIVAKVDALMALCDQLETALTTTDTTRTRLLESLLHEALEPAVTAQEAAE